MYFIRILCGVIKFVLNPLDKGTFSTESTGLRTVLLLLCARVERAVAEATRVPLRTAERESSAHAATELMPLIYWYLGFWSAQDEAVEAAVVARVAVDERIVASVGFDVNAWPVNSQQILQVFAHFLDVSL